MKKKNIKKTVSRAKDSDDEHPASEPTVYVAASRAVPKNAFSMLVDLDDAEGSEASDDNQPQEEKRQEPQPQDDEQEEVEAEAEPQVEMSTIRKPATGNKKAKKNAKNRAAPAKQHDDEQDDSLKEGKEPEKGSKKKQNKKKKGDVADYLSQLAEDDNDNEESSTSSAAAPKQEAKAQPAKKEKGGKKKADAADYLAQFGENPDEEAAAEKPKQETATKKDKKQKQKPAAKKPTDQEQLAAKEQPKPSAPPKKLNEKAEAFRLLLEQKKKEEEARLEEERRKEEEEERLLQMLKDKEKQAKKSDKKTTTIGKKEKLKAREDEALKKRREELLRSGFVAALKKDSEKPPTPKPAKPKEKKDLPKETIGQQSPQQAQQLQESPVEKERDSWEELEDELNDVPQIVGNKQETDKISKVEEAVDDNEIGERGVKVSKEELIDNQHILSTLDPRTIVCISKIQQKIHLFILGQCNLEVAEFFTLEEAKTFTQKVCKHCINHMGKHREDKKATSIDAKKTELRSPICCVLGHVDTGKTKILDKIRNTNVQKDEAGGITQQIGATYIPIDSIKKEAKKLGEKVYNNIRIPGLLIIDTPGHESFTNLRSRGTNLCDIAILVVDIMHSLERQTIESINLLKQRRVPFIVALNKIDQIYDWKANPNSPIRETLKEQPSHTIIQFKDRVKEVIGAFNQQGFNASLYYENKDFKNYVSLVPTSAHTGEGIPDLLTLMMQITQHFMSQKITYKDEFQCTILEFKVVEGHGTTIDVILVNGIIREGDKIVVCTLNGPVVTTIRALLVPKPLREIRVKGEYTTKKEVRAAMGIKIAAQDLDGAVPGSSMLVAKPGDDIEELKDTVMADLQQMLTRINKSGKGVYVQASTLGSLEALLDFLNSENIPICGINVGPVHKKDVMMASVMLDSNPEYAIIMAFDVPATKEAQLEADKLGVQIFKADIIYHLCDKFMAHMNKIREEKKKKTQMEAVWPCIIKIIPDHVFHKKDPITVGVDILEGILKIGTPLIIPTRDNLEIGRCISIQHNKVSINEAGRGKAVSVQIENNKSISIGRHFEETDTIYSKITRNSIDLLKEHFKADIKKDDLKLLQKIKKILNVPDAIRAKKSDENDSDEDV